MKIFKKTFVLLLALLLALSLIACSSKDPEEDLGQKPESGQELEDLNVGVAFYPMKEILELIEEDLKSDGFNLKIHEFSDYQVPNNLLDNEELDANMIQHDYFLQVFNKANDADLVTVLPIYHATYALYSKDYSSLDDIPQGASITLPDDDTNLGRALYLLGQAGLLTFQEQDSATLSLDDIKDNPKDLILDDQVPLTSLAQRYTETGLAVMYPTYARSLELEGNEERLYVEETDKVTEDFAISLVARNDNKDSQAIKSLITNIKSDKVREFLVENYSWASSPAF